MSTATSTVERRGWLAVGSIAATALLLFGPVLFVSLIARETSTLARTFDATGITTLAMDVDDGSILVVGDEQTSIRVEAVVNSGLIATTPSIALVGDRLSLGSRCPSPLSHYCSVDWVVHVPPGIRLEGRSSDTAVRVNGVRGGMAFASTDGALILDGVAGDVDVTTRDGEVRATGLGAGSVRATARDGDVELEFAEPPSAVAVSGRDGSVAVVLPPGSGPYALSASAVDGVVTTPVRTDPSSERTVTVTSRDGDVVVRYAAV